MSNADTDTERRDRFIVCMGMLLAWLASWAAATNALAYRRDLEAYDGAYKHTDMPLYGAEPMLEKIPARPNYWMWHDVGVDFWMRATVTSLIVVTVLFGVAAFVIIMGVTTFVDRPRTAEVVETD